MGQYQYHYSYEMDGSIQIDFYYIDIIAAGSNCTTTKLMCILLCTTDNTGSSRELLVICAPIS